MSEHIFLSFVRELEKVFFCINLSVFWIFFVNFEVFCVNTKEIFRKRTRFENWHIFTPLLHNSFIFHIQIFYYVSLIFPSYAKQTTWHPFYYFFSLSNFTHMSHTTQEAQEHVIIQEKHIETHDVISQHNHLLSSTCLVIAFKCIFFRFPWKYRKKVQKKSRHITDILKFSYFRHQLFIHPQIHTHTHTHLVLEENCICWHFSSLLFKKKKNYMKHHHHIQFTFLSTSAKKNNEIYWIKYC